MIQTFTPNDVVRFLYHEMPSEEAQVFQEALVLDASLMDMFQRLKAAQDTLVSTPVTKAPPERVIKRILTYSLVHDLEAVSQ